MDDRIRAFIANEGWLLVAILTFALTSIAGIAGLGALAGAISVIGWFLLTPVLLFWGDEVALLLEDADATGTTQTTETDAESDPLEELKRRYAAGEIDETEFERRLERLVAVDEIPDDAIGSGAADETPTDTVRVDEASDEATRTEPLERETDLDHERERECDR
ncbi:SHOCT domain-containing protein [Natrinema versiforme]|uniref:SHOCT domain-containing protein n=1 Tax=Natrinema versiforme TaxID=88724 RepID=A0A4P8WGT9_9EURY|nr:SHOCT domain-containing protein [Natrinema versiforme]QCS42212.1 SHOCT domain-containing protein [Natrinema versiforme]